MNDGIFNNVIGPVMRGPASSHCAAVLDEVIGAARQIASQMPRARRRTAPGRLPVAPASKKAASCGNHCACH